MTSMGASVLFRGTKVPSAVPLSLPVMIKRFPPSYRAERHVSSDSEPHHESEKRPNEGRSDEVAEHRFRSSAPLYDLDNVSQLRSTKTKREMTHGVHATADHQLEPT